jgi:cation transport regulator ChaB
MNEAQKEGGKALVAAAPQARLTDQQRRVIGLLIDLTRAAFHALDDSEERQGDDGRVHVIHSNNFDAVSNALDRLDELPDDRPGYTLGPAGKAEWALLAEQSAAPQTVTAPRQFTDEQVAALRVAADALIERYAAPIRAILDNAEHAPLARAHSEQGSVQRIAELEKERDHWKANHDAQVERARVLMERTDVPLERTRAYQHMRTLQRLVDVQKTLLEAFTGQLEAPADFNACTDDPIPAFPHSLKRLTDAYCVQQPLPVPDQMALVYRVDIGRLRGSWIHKNAYFESTVPAMQKIRAAIQDYHFALDSRARGLVAQDLAFNAICQALGMQWEQGKELQRRANAASGELNQANEQGKA